MLVPCTGSDISDKPEFRRHHIGRVGETTQATTTTSTQATMIVTTHLFQSWISNAAVTDSSFLGRAGVIIIDTTVTTQATTIMIY